MEIGVPREIKTAERRVGLTPATAGELVNRGHKVSVETGAGDGAGFNDGDYKEVGAVITGTPDDVFADSEMIVKVKEPLATERARLQPHHTLFTYLHLAADRPQTDDLLASGATCIAYETVTDDAGRLPLLAPMSAIAGRMSIQAGAHALEATQGGAGLLLGGVPGVRPGKVVIIGGGVVGENAAEMAVGLGAEVTVLDRSPAVLDGLAKRFAGRVKTVYSTKAELDASVFDADLVIIGIGILPNVELAEEAGLDCNNGIVVDKHCRTSDPNIYAAGDCSNHPNALLDRRLRLESVPNAMEQARVCASNMLGGDKAYASIPWFWSDQYELKLQMVGFSSDGNQQVLRGDMATNEFAVFYLNDGKVVAADAVNSPKEFMICKQLVGKMVDVDVLADPDADLKSLAVE